MEERNKNSKEIKKNKSRESQDKHKTTVIEWIISGLGAAIFLFSIGYLIASIFILSGEPPNILIEVKSISKQGKHYLIQVEIENKGTETAEGLKLEAQLKMKDSTLEKSSVVFDYLPGNSKRNGGLMFSHNPKEYNLEIRPLGYEQP